MSDPNSLLVTYLWDMRAAVEAQLRTLTTVQRSRDGYVGLARAEDRRTEKAKILKDLHEIATQNRAINASIGDAILQAEAELTAQ